MCKGYLVSRFIVVECFKRLQSVAKQAQILQQRLVKNLTYLPYASDQKCLYGDCSRRRYV